MSDLPLAGLKVLDLSWVVAGPYCTQAMALLGAEVIKVESESHTDVMRRLPPFAPGGDGIDVERSGGWQGLNLEKRSVTLNLREPEAQEIALELVRRADVVIENFAEGQIERFGLNYERLREVNPGIIMVTSTGLGKGGPYSGYATFGPPMTAYTGLASITGQEGGTPERWLGGVWSDHQAGMSSLFGLLVALEHRERTGEGQVVEYSMAEAITAQIPEAFIEYGVTGAVPGPRGNSDPAMCPHGIYPAAGRDRWVAVAVQDDEDWERLRAAIDGPSWWAEPALSTIEGRLARRAEIEAALAAWTSMRDDRAAAKVLQEAGISAGIVVSPDDLLIEPALRERGFFLTQEHPVVGRREMLGMGWNVPLPQGGMVGHAPLLGEHNWQVLVEELGITPERFADLVDRRVVF